MIDNVRPIAYETKHLLCHLCVTKKRQFLLCEALKNTGLARSPEEYFLNGEGWEDSSWARQHGVRSRSDYLNLVFEQGTSSNRVFGTNVMWNYFHTMLKTLQELPEYGELNAPQLMGSLFPNVHYIWIVRRDKAHQAVSWAKAGQTDVYAWPKGERPVPKREPTFDFGFIGQLHNLILEGEAGWQSFFEECGVRPLKIESEDLVKPMNQRHSAFLNI